MALFRQPEVDWLRCEEPEEKVKDSIRPKPEAIVKREKNRQEKLRKIKQKEPSLPPEDVLVYREAAAIDQFSSWTSCTVALTVIANKEIYADGHEQIWLLIDTKDVEDPRQAAKDYHLRISTEERYRQLKCFIDLVKFTSRAFSMITNQVVFTMLAYNLLQLHLFRQKRKELNQKTMPHIRQQLLPSDNHIIVYHQNYYGMFRPFELVQFVVELGEQPRKKIAQKCRRIGRELNTLLNNPRPP